MAFERPPEKLYPHDYVMKAVILPFIPVWVTPNAVTILRFLMIPFVFWRLMIEDYRLGIPLFLLAAFTDAIDGSLARVRKQITQWGTFYDPLADKLLIGSVVLFIVGRHLNIWFAVVIVFMELLIVIGGWRQRRKGKLISANIFGKTKMLLQVIGVACLLISIWTGSGLLMNISIGVLSLAIAFAGMSAVTYGL